MWWGLLGFQSPELKPKDNGKLAENCAPDSDIARGEICAGSQQLRATVVPTCVDSARMQAPEMELKGSV